jgi:flavin-dependent dehydrogenase
VNEHDVRKGIGRIEPRRWPSRAEVVIVGGGPAGLTAAIALLDAEPSLSGRVVVLEKARYPRDKYCAGAIGGRGEKILSSLGALPKVPCVAIDGLSVRALDKERAVAIGRMGSVVRRIEFDSALAAIAVERGVCVLEDARADRVETNGDGATVHTSLGSFEGRIAVGADGVGSAVRKAMKLSAGRLRAQVLELDTEPVPQDRPRNLLHFDVGDLSLSGYYWDFPTVVGGKDLVCRGIYHLRVGNNDVDIQASLAARLRAMGLDIADYTNKRFAERGYDSAERLSRGPLMLIGEAAGIEAVTGEGISQAIEYGAMAGRFAADVLAGKRAMEDWTRHVSSSRLGRDLSARARFIQTLFGPRRQRLQDAFASDDDVLAAGCRHFAALPMDVAGLARIAARVGVLWLQTRVPC